ncbi:MAG: dinitrogenase iron-molybdenum cofactor biosynthesis protein [SAR324 cluster bacterium]|nr:dinitrogenase iron-molybdenum cofactor biosynthesis protein [SAR324 cluster bacterium]
MEQKVLIPLYGDDVAPRFDLATEILIARTNSGKPEMAEKIIVLPQASAEKLCHLVLTEGIGAVICGGIEEEFYHYLIWKKVIVLDSVIGSWKSALNSYNQGVLTGGMVLT